MSDDLKPCPFCGGIKVLLVDIAEVYSVRCQCNAEGPYEFTPAEAIAAWNRRAVPAAKESEVQHG